MGIVGNTIDIFQRIFENPQYKYVAMLDGDDWWCDENKLQMQVDLMEENEAVSFCYMRATSNINQMKAYDSSISIRNMFDDIRKTGISNGTILHRASMMKLVPFEKLKSLNLLSMDYSTNVYMAKMGKVAYINRVSLFWRRTGNTTSSASSKEKAYRYIDHEVRQGLFLASEFPNTSYAFSKSEAEEFRCWQMYMWAYSNKDYASITDILNNQDFPHRWLETRGEYHFLNNKISFYAYVYFIRKVQTLIKLFQEKL